MSLKLEAVLLDPGPQAPTRPDRRETDSWLGCIAFVESRFLHTFEASGDVAHP